MKIILIAVAIVLSLVPAASVTNEDPKMDQRVVSAFQKDFSFAKNVKWESTGEFSQVRFSLNDQSFAAWYNSDAELVSTARNILYMQLPLSVIKSLEENYGQAEFLSILEVTKNNETSYHIQAEEKNKEIFLRASPSGNLFVVKKIKK